MVINIYSKGKYPANILSNFAPNCFDFDGFTQIPCMESFLQSLKFEDLTEQRKVLYMTAKEAKKTGNNKSWSKYLFWNGQKIDRFSKEYRLLIKTAYRSLLLNSAFRIALLETKNRILLHTIGKTFRKNTVLTWWEFVGVLYELRRELKRNKLNKI